MNKLNVFCFGFGQVAENFVKKLKAEKIPFQLTTTSREETRSKNFEDINYQSFHFDEKKFDINLIKHLEEADHILISIAPINGDDIVIKNFKTNFNDKKYQWITYLSATSVYGNHDGEWVDEKSKTNPTSKQGIHRLKAEQSWIKLAKNNNLPLQIFRLSGIYSNQHNVLKRLETGVAKIIKKKNHFFSRIHVEDIANVLFKSLKNFKEREIYNISDDKPCSSEEVTIYGAKILNLSLPKKIDIIDIESEMLKNFYKDSKKVSNKKMKYFFNYNLKFPTYIEGLDNIRNNII